jgi:nicotinamidase-related amidase
VTCWGADRYFTFEPQKTALLVIDMQRHFIGGSEEPEPEPAASISVSHEVVASDAEQPLEAEDDSLEMTDPREIIPHVVRLVNAARNLGCHLVHTREGYSPDLSDVSDFRRELDYVGHATPIGRSLIRGEHGHDFVDELQPLPGETVIDKASFGAFFRTDLDAKLRAAGVTHLILCGVTTQCCVHSTLREAVDLGYWCLTVADCCAASEPGLHEAALMLIAGEGHLFGWIADVADIEQGAAPIVA